VASVFPWVVTDYVPQYIEMKNLFSDCLFTTKEKVIFRWQRGGLFFGTAISTTT
jgi:hypothetical protein